ncbi:MAG: hypothetical protein WDA11_05315 [Thiohalomonadaceae bacterium]
MGNEDQERVQAFANELRWLKQVSHNKPSHWALSRIAALEGILAAYREQSAWEETQRILAKLNARE